MGCPLNRWRWHRCLRTTGPRLSCRLRWWRRMSNATGEFCCGGPWPPTTEYRGKVLILYCNCNPQWSTVIHSYSCHGSNSSNRICSLLLAANTTLSSLNYKARLIPGLIAYSTPVAHLHLHTRDQSTPHTLHSASGLQLAVVVGNWERKGRAVVVNCDCQLLMPMPIPIPIPIPARCCTACLVPWLGIGEWYRCHVTGVNSISRKIQNHFVKKRQKKAHLAFRFGSAFREGNIKKTLTNAKSLIHLSFTICVFFTWHLWI